MSLIYTTSEPEIQPADLLLRKKHSGVGWHFGTGLSGGLVKDTTPETGKRVATPDQFFAGRPGMIIRYPRTPQEKWAVEQRALSDLQSGYDATADNCEHDSNFAQIGVATSPTANGLIAIGLVGLGLGIVKLFSDD